MSCASAGSTTAEAPWPLQPPHSLPVLVVGSKWDPATNYEGALKAASLLPNSRLLGSDSWGHGSYRASKCVTSAVDTYLLTQVVPARGTTCVGDVQPRGMEVRP